MNRLKEKSDLLVELGALFGPLLRLVANASDYNQQERSQTIARYLAESPKFWRKVQTFSTGQPGHDYQIEFYRCHGAIESIRNRSIGGEPLESIVPVALANAQAAIDAIPVPPTSVILEAGSPFTAYCRLRELCEVDATISLTWLDPYMGAPNFHRYIASVRSTAAIKIVTCDPGTNPSKKDLSRWAEFLDVSRLYAAERGHVAYSLLIQPNLHDRWVVFDDKRIYQLGGSAKDAAVKDYFTIGVVDASTANLQIIQNHISTGAEFFGPTVTTHK